MHVLAVDTSSHLGSVAISRDDAIVGEVRLEAALQHSESLFGAIEFLLKNLRLDVAGMDLFAAARGPGSFTGLRIGLAAMEGFGFARGKPATGISTLAAAAWQAGETGALIAPISDARRGEVYAALYSRDGEVLVELRPPSVLKPAEWFDSLPRQPILFCGSGSAAQGERIASCPDWRLEPGSPFLAAAIARMAPTANGEPLEPLYLRPTSAERNRKLQEQQ